jgi:hypothetical protein
MDPVPCVAVFQMRDSAALGRPDLPKNSTASGP